MSAAPGRRRFALRLLPGLALGGMTAGCGSLHPEVKQLDELDADSVMLVGRIELIPALQPTEQDLKMSSLGDFDPFDAKSKLRNRAILYLSDRPDAPREPTRHASNPPLDQLFFMRIPKRQRFLAHAMVFIKHRVRVTGPRSAELDTSEVWLPLRLEFDIRAGDRALYVGTWRARRDDFNQVDSVQILDHYPAAQAEMRRRYGSDAGLRKALPNWRDART